MQNAEIADRLDAFSSLLELRDADPYTVRAYRRAAETIRAAAVPVAELVRSRRVGDLRGIGPGIEARLRELVETGTIAELVELERELAPDLVGLGRYLGLGAKRSLELARALDVRSADELREAAAAGRLRAVPGIGSKTEARLLDALAREGQPRRGQGLLLNRARELVGGVAAALGGEVAGDVRRCVLAQLDSVQASVHGGQRMPEREMTKRVEEALRNPYVRCLSHPKGRYINRRPENALDLERTFEVALEEGVALEVNGLPARLDLSGEHVRDALRAGVRVVCSTDAHSVRGLENMTFSVMTARRGWATAPDVVNTRPLRSILARSER